MAAPRDPIQVRRLEQECDDTYRRALAGGLFYLVAWVIVAFYGGEFARAPALAAGIAVLFGLIGGARFVHRPPREGAAGAQYAWLLRHWGLVYATSVAWSAVFVWTVVDPAFAPGRTASLLSTLAFATAFAHTFSMRLALATGGMALLYLPGLAMLWTDPAQRAEAVVMTVYLVYVVFAMLHAYRAYQQRLDLDQDLRDQRDLFARQSRSDALTGLANRRHFGDALSGAIAARAPLALLILDLDHFKGVNDAHGHAVGDACLIAFAERLRAAFALPGTMVARLGGEEFAVVLEGAVAAQALERAEQFRLSLAATPIRAEGMTLPVPVTVSVGLAVFDARVHANSDGLYRAADRAVYDAKKLGRNRVCVEGVRERS
jgi:diguanylate cyclase (GGDEF)-like protein